MCLLQCCDWSGNTFRFPLQGENVLLNILNGDKSCSLRVNLIFGNGTMPELAQTHVHRVGDASNRVILRCPLHHLTPVRMAIIKKSANGPSWWSSGSESAFQCRARGFVAGQLSSHSAATECSSSRARVPQLEESQQEDPVQPELTEKEVYK